MLIEKKKTTHAREVLAEKESANQKVSADRKDRPNLKASAN